MPPYGSGVAPKSLALHTQQVLAVQVGKSRESQVPCEPALAASRSGQLSKPQATCLTDVFCGGVGLESIGGSRIGSTGALDF